MDISIGICTWNRAELLDQTLRYMKRLEIPEGIQWELLIVNNNSTDHTEDVIHRHAQSLPVEYLFESKPGKSHALNHALREAKGEYILWTDDDALVDKGWLAAYYAAFQKWKDAAIFGGPVEAKFMGSAPPWLDTIKEKIPFVYSILDYGDRPVEFAEGRLPFGINLAVKTDIHRSYLYDTNLGPKPNSSLRMEEWALASQMIEDGLKGMWVPDARVVHVIPESRLSLAFVRDYCRGWGEYLAMADGEVNCAKLFGKPRWRWRKAAEKELKYRFNRIFAEPEIWIDDLVEASKEWGRLLGSRRKLIR